MSQLALNYNKLIIASWDVVKKRPYLWWLALLSGGFGGGGFQFGGFDIKDFDKVKDTKTATHLKNVLGEVAGAVVDKSSSSFTPGAIAAVLVFGLLIFIVLMIINSIARPGLIKSVENISRGQEMNFGLGWGEGKRYWKRIFSLQMLIFLVAAVLVAPVAAMIVIFVPLPSLVLSSAGVVAGLMFFFFFFFIILVLLGLSLLVGLFVPYVERQIVIEDLGVGQVLGEAFNFVKQHFKEVVIVYLINFGLTLLWMLAVVVSVFILSFLIVLIVDASAIVSKVLAIVFGWSSILIVVLLLLWSVRVFGSFSSTFLTGVYLALKSSES